MKLLCGFFIKMFYRKSKGFSPLHILATCFFPQKIIRINGSVPWPVDWRSRVLYHKRIITGNRTAPGWSHGCYIQGRNGIIIGHNVRMGPGVGLISSNHSIDDYDSWTKTKPIAIGDNVWIGMNSVILPGVKIGNNIVIGANSVVTKDIPSDSIVAGNPCCFIKKKEPYIGKDYSKI